MLTELGDLSPSEEDLGGQSLLRKFLGSKEYLDPLNDTGKICFTQNSTQIYWNTSLAAPALFPMFTQSINFYICYIIKEDRCLKNVTHLLERNE